MRTNPLLRRGIAVVVIALLLALAFAPSINANVSKEDELVEVTTEFCGLGKKHTVQLTQQEAQELDVLFDTIHVRLEDVESEEETIQIFNDAIVELDKYGLLGRMNVEQVQRLITNRFQNSKLVRFLLQSSYGPLDDNENRNCLVIGRTSHTVFFGGIFYFLVERPSSVYNMWRPLKLFPSVSFGRYIDEYTSWEYLPAKGWVWTSGSNGVKEWNGSLYGQISTIEYYDMISGYLFYRFYVGATHFKGISIYFPDGKEIFLLGHAAQVYLDTHRP